MAGRRGIEDHMIVGARLLGIAQQQSEFIESGDFHGAGAREPLLQKRDFLIRQHAAIGRDGALAVIERSLFGVDIHCLDAGGTGDGSRMRTKLRV